MPSESPAAASVRSSAAKRRRSTQPSAIKKATPARPKAKFKTAPNGSESSRPPTKSPSPAPKSFVVEPPASRSRKRTAADLDTPDEPSSKDRLRSSNTEEVRTSVTKPNAKKARTSSPKALKGESSSFTIAQVFGREKGEVGAADDKGKEINAVEAGNKGGVLGNCTIM